VRWSVLILLVATLLPSAAIAVPPDATAIQEAEALAQEAKDRFAARDFEVAAKLFMKAYAKSHVPSLVFNAARAYEEAGKTGDAASLFRLYITLTDDADGILEARQHLAKLEAEPAVVPSDEPFPASPKTSVMKSSVPAEPDRTTAWWPTGGAVAVIAIGAGLMMDGAGGTQRYSGVNRSAYESARTEWISGAVLVGAGVVLGGVSAYLWTRSPVVVVPTPNAVAIGGTF
jgi:hypothetical protein